MRWIVPSISACMLIGAPAFLSADCVQVEPPLHAIVKYADAIVVGTVVNVSSATVHVDQRIKGTVPRSIHLVEHFDNFECRRPLVLVQGSRELMFLKREAEGYAQVDPDFGRWSFRNGRMVRVLNPPDYRKSIARLLRLDARVERGGDAVISAYIDGLRDSDPLVKQWAAQEAAEHVDTPPQRLVDAYLTLWDTNDRQLRARVATSVLTWKLASFTPTLARALTLGTDAERDAVAGVLGGRWDLEFLSLLRTAATSDPSEQVRGEAYEALMYLLGDACVPDLLVGAKDSSPRVRLAVARDACHAARVDEDFRPKIQPLLAMLADDPDPNVQRTARSCSGSSEHR